MGTTSIDLQVDARGLACPMPIVKTAQAIKTVVSGDTVEVLATDSGSVKDFAAWAKTTGNPLIEQTTDGGVFRFVVGTNGTSKAVSGNKLTLPANATVEVVPIGAYPPLQAVILSSANTVGSPDAWTVTSNTYNYVIVKSGNDILLQRHSKGTLLLVR